MKTDVRSGMWMALIAATGLIAVSCGMSLAIAQPPGQEGGRGGGQRRSEIETKPADAKAKDDKITAVVGADIHTVTREVIRRGTILIQNGKILKVGQNIKVPDGATVIDAAGRVITPGFVSITTSGVALTGASASGQGFADQLNPFDDNVRIALGVGITTACLQTRGSGRGGRGRAEEGLFPGLDPFLTERSPGGDDYNPDFGDRNTSVCACCGLPILPTEPIEEVAPEPIRPMQNVVLKMSAGRLDGMLISDSVFYHVTPGALSGALNRHQWRETIGKARAYLKEQAEHEKKTAAGEKSAPPRKPVGDDVLQLVKHEIALRVSADSVNLIHEVIDLAKELDYKLVIDSAIEGWVGPDELAEAGVAVVITPRQRRRAQFAREDSTGSNIESSRIFEQAGVAFAVSPLGNSISLDGLAGRDLTSLPLEAAFAVRGGCSEKAALEALTIVPARMMKLDSRIGSIEEGKDADLLLLNGQPLDYKTYVETAIVNGHVVYERAKDRVLPVYDR